MYVHALLWTFAGANLVDSQHAVGPHARRDSLVSVHVSDECCMQQVLFEGCVWAAANNVCRTQQVSDPDCLQSAFNVHNGTKIVLPCQVTPGNAAESCACLRYANHLQAPYSRAPSATR
jgi:hypothetical protein